MVCWLVWPPNEPGSHGAVGDMPGSFRAEPPGPLSPVAQRGEARSAQRRPRYLRDRASLSIGFASTSVMAGSVMAEEANGAFDGIGHPSPRRDGNVVLRHLATPRRPRQISEGRGG